MADDDRPGIRFWLALGAMAIAGKTMDAIANFHRGRCANCGAQIESDRFAKRHVCSRKCKRALYGPR